jgi:tetratricopeptide (TPR) repeat protein
MPSETGSKLAAAYCFRGHGLTEKRQLDAALADLNESMGLDPIAACAPVWPTTTRPLQYDPADAYSWNNRGQARMWLGDKAGAIADFRKALEISPGLRTASDSLKRLGAVQ